MLLKHREGIKNTKVVDKDMLRNRSQNIPANFAMYLTHNHTEYSIYSEKTFYIYAPSADWALQQ